MSTKTFRHKKESKQDVAKDSELNIKKEYLRLLLRILMTILVGWFIFTNIFVFKQNHGMDMFPSIKDGDLLLVYGLQKEYPKDQVVHYDHNGKSYVGRVVACGGDLINIEEESGTLIVNNGIQQGEILYPTYPGNEITFPYTVPEGHVFVLGDYRTKSRDSRMFGPIPLKNVNGKIITVLRRRGI